MQTTSVTGGDFSCKRQLETPLRCKLQEKIASCDSALTGSVLNSDQIQGKLALVRVSGVFELARFYCT